MPRPTLHRIAPALLALLCAASLSACGPLEVGIHDRDLAALRAVRHYLIYWVGMSFRGIPLRQVSTDPSGSVDIQYGDCIRGTEACTAPLVIINSPDASFIPGGPYAHRSETLRGVPVFSADGGRTIHVAAGRVVVTVVAQGAADALAAVRALGTINAGIRRRDDLPYPAPGTAADIGPAARAHARLGRAATAAAAIRSGPGATVAIGGPSR